MEYSRYLYVGFDVLSPNGEFNCDNRYKETAFMFACNGYFWSGGECKKYGFRLEQNTFYKITFELCFLNGYIKVYIDDKDQGYAVQNNETLKSNDYFLTVSGSWYANVVLL